MHKFSLQSTLKLGEFLLQLTENFTYHFFNYSFPSLSTFFPWGISSTSMIGLLDLSLKYYLFFHNFHFLMFSLYIFGNMYHPWSSRPPLHISFTSCIKLLRWEIILLSPQSIISDVLEFSAVFLLILYSSCQVFGHTALLAVHGFCLFSLIFLG